MFLTVLSSYCCIITNASSGSGSGSGSVVVDLTASTFEHQTQAATGATTGNWFVKFYAPWCGHCRMLKPTWEDAAVALAEQDDDAYATFATVDCTKEKIVCERFEVKGYPTLLFFHQGKMVRYNGQRTKSALLEYVNGGYKTTIDGDDAQEVPPEISRWSVFMDELKKEFSELIEQRKMFIVLLILGSIAFGVFIGYLLEGKDPGATNSPSAVDASKKKDEKKDQ